MHFRMPTVQASSCFRRDDRNETPPLSIACWHLTAFLAATASLRPPSSTTMEVGTGVGTRVAVTPGVEDAVITGVDVTLALTVGTSVGVRVEVTVGVTVPVGTAVAVTV